MKKLNVRLLIAILILLCIFGFIGCGVKMNEELLEVGEEIVVEVVEEEIKEYS